MLFFIMGMILTLFLFLIFHLFSKESSWNQSAASTFECGFSSYFYSRFSFSIHYFMIGLIFLFLDLELCYMLPFINSKMSNLKISFYFFFFLTVLILSILMEWKKEKLEWKF